MRIRELTFLLAFAAAAPAETIVVFDQSDTPLAELREAVQTATRVFDHAGIETTWTICRVSSDPNQHCVLPPPGTYLQGIVIRKPAGPQRAREAMGSAWSARGEKAILFYVFLDPAKHLADAAERPVSVVLGCIIAHEIGHLMGLPHRPSGIMKPKFEPIDIRNAAMGNLNL